MGTVNNMVSCNGAATKISFSKQENRVFAGNKFLADHVRVGPTESELDLSDLDASGQLNVGNGSTTASLLMGFATGAYPMEAKPNGLALVPLASATDTIYWKSSVADREIGAFTADDSTDLITVGSDHGLVVGRIVRFTTTDTLPAGLALLTDYFVIAVTPTTISVSLYPNGTAVDITDTGTGTHTATEVYPCYVTYLALQA